MGNGDVYAPSQVYPAAFSNYHQADHGQGLVYGTILVKPMVHCAMSSSCASRSQFDNEMKPPVCQAFILITFLDAHADALARGEREKGATK